MPWRSRFRSSDARVAPRRYRRPVLQRALDVVFPPRCAGCGDRGVAVLRPVPRRSHRPVAAVVRSMRRAVGERTDRGLPRLPARTDRTGPGAVRVRGAGATGGAPPQVPGGARCRPGARRLPWRRATPGQADVVTWVPLDSPAQGRARLRPGAGAGGRGGARARPCPGRRLLRRVRSTGPQAKRDAAERRAAMRGAFVVRDRIHGAERTCCSSTTCSRRGPRRRPAPRRCSRRARRR